MGREREREWRERGGRKIEKEKESEGDIDRERWGGREREMEWRESGGRKMEKESEGETSPILSFDVCLRESKVMKETHLDRNPVRFVEVRDIEILRLLRWVEFLPK